MNVAMSVGLAFAAIIGVCLFVLWYGSAAVIDKHEDRITVMENRWDETFGGPEPAGDDSPGELAGVQEKPCIDHECVGVQVCPRCGGPAACAYATCGCDDPDESPTDEIPVAPPTVPDGMPLAVQSALLRPSPVPRGKSAEWVEPAIAAMRARNAERMARAVTEEAS